MFRIRRFRQSVDLVGLAGIGVALGLLPLPQEYYMLVRILLCGLCIYCLASMPRVRDWEKWALTGLAILHNPVAPIELGGRLIWAAVGAGTVLWLWWLGRRARW